MTEQTKPRYELRRSSDNYVLLCEGDHCLCRICVKKTRGALDAQLILLAMNSREDLLNACELIKRVVAKGKEGADLSVLYELVAEIATAALENAKPKTAEKEAAK